MEKVQTLKGFRDINPEEALKRGRVLSLLKSVFKTYGFAPMETPTLEYAKVLEGKYGEEGEKLIYKFEDRGGRDAALRYDLTVPLARYIAENKGKVTLPFKRYQIGSVFRAEKPQAGRYREFTQVDVDTVGVDTALADAEILATFATALQLLGIKDFTILVNDRATIMDITSSLSQEKKLEVARIFDKWEKIGEENVEKAFEGMEEDMVKANLTSRALIRDLENSKPSPRLEEIFKLLKEFGVDEKFWKFEPRLARGLDYYTGMIFEVRVEGNPISLGGGGRYDNMIGIFSGEKIPAVGGSFGLDRIEEVVPKETFAEIPFQPKVLVTVFSPDLLNQTIRLFTQLQGQGVETELYLDPAAKLDKQLKYADRKGIPYALILGPEEARTKQVTLKNLKEGTQQTISVETLLKTLSLG